MSAEYYSREAFQARNAARQATIAAREAVTLNPLRARLTELTDPALRAEAAQLDTAAHDLAAELQTLRERLAAYEHTPPADRNAVDAWARERATLRDQVDALALLHTQAAARAEAAARGVRLAMQQAFLTEFHHQVDHLQDTLRAAKEQAEAIKREAEAALLAAERPAVEARESVEAWRRLASELGVSGRQLRLPGEGYNEAA